MTDAPKPLPNPPVNLAQVLADEKQELTELCSSRQGSVADLRPSQQQRCALPEDRIPDRLGVAFSGGGIRSASLNLGLIQALAKCKLFKETAPDKKNDLLRQVHYMSGISGGGYILGWLSAWISRRGFDPVQKELEQNTLQQDPPLPPPKADSPDYFRFLEPQPIRHLRQYTSFLTPRMGLASGDTLAMAALYSRNLLLNQTLMVAAVGAVLALAQLLAPSITWACQFPICLLWFLAGVAFLSGIGGGIAIGRSMGCMARNQDPKEPRHPGGRALLLICLSAVCVWLLLPSAFSIWGYVPVLIGAALWVVVISLTAVIAFKSARGKSVLGAVKPSRWAWVWATAFAAGLYSLLIFGFRKWLLTDSSQISVSDLYVALGLPALLGALVLTSYLLIGILGDAMPDAEREWLGRLGGFLLFYAALAALVLLIALRGPMWMNLLFSRADVQGAGTSWLKWILPGGWLFTVASGLLAAKSPASGGPNQKTKLDILVKVAPPVFLIGVLLVISWGVHALARHYQAPEYLYSAEWTKSQSPTSLEVNGVRLSVQGTNDKNNAAQPKIEHHDLPALYGKTGSAEDYAGMWPPAGVLGIMFAIMAFITLLLSMRLDVNEFSMHLFYRNRLIRAFLGASNKGRKASPFSGFAVDDDVPFAVLCANTNEEERKKYVKPGTPRYNGPYPLWGTALNLTTGEDLAWQKRKAASFMYSPLYCGYDYVSDRRPPDPGEGPDSDQKCQGGRCDYGYRGTGCYTQKGERQEPAYTGHGGGPSLGTAMAASGAAISPNWGYHTTPTVAALLALFNVRIGWWTGNPRSAKGWSRYAPGPYYLLNEVAGATGDNDKFVYLSDGGHFENLGIYELVRRRVKFIIACDADADPDYSFEDLGNAVEKCRRDFGVEIEMRGTRAIQPDKTTGFSRSHCAVGIIKYPPLNQSSEETQGVLLYLKSSLKGNEPADVLTQHATNPAFPHDTTVNQFFNETQFEVYRALGEHMFSSLWKDYEWFSGDSSAPANENDRVELIRDRVTKFFTSYLPSLNYQD